MREQCLEYALTHGEKFGIWGGMSERERRRVRRERAQAQHRAALANGTASDRPSSGQPQPRRSSQPSLTGSTRIEPPGADTGIDTVASCCCVALGAIHIDPDGDPGAPTVASPSASADIDVSDAPAVQIPVRARHLSPSSASMFRQCPQRWKFRYVDGLPDPPGEAALTSAFAHRVLEELLNVEPSARTLDRARGFAKQIWSESTSCKDFVALDLDADAVRNFKWTAWRAIEGLWEIEDPKSVDVIDTETEVSVEIGGVPFIGHIDRVEVTIDGLIVSDYKSRRAPGRSISEDLDQVLLYAAALGEIHGTLPAGVRLMYLGQRIVETAVTVEAVAEVTGSWRHGGSVAPALGRCEFPPRPSPFCGSCAFVHHCPSLAEVERQHRSPNSQGHSYNLRAELDRIPAILHQRDGGQTTRIAAAMANALPFHTLHHRRRQATDRRIERV